MSEGLKITGPIATRAFDMPKACQAFDGHAHNYDHVTIVVRGRIKVSYSYEKDGQTVTGESGEFGPGEMVTIKAGVRHTIKPLEDNTSYLCVFSHRDLDGLVTQAYTGNQRAYV